MEQQQVSINVAGYVAAKANGAAKVLRIDGKVNYVTKRFHPETGEQLQGIVPIDRKAIEAFRAKAIVDHDALIAGLDAILADIDSAQQA